MKTKLAATKIKIVESMKEGKMSKSWLAFIDNPADLPLGKEVEISIRDLTPGRQKFDGHNVKAILASSPEKLPGGDTLWLRSLTGVLHPKPMGIKITKELDEYIPARPYSDYELTAGSEGG